MINTHSITEDKEAETESVGEVGVQSLPFPEGAVVPTTRPCQCSEGVSLPCGNLRLAPVSVALLSFPARLFQTDSSASAAAAAACLRPAATRCCPTLTTHPTPLPLWPQQPSLSLTTPRCCLLLLPTLSTTPPHDPLPPFSPPASSAAGFSVSSGSR